jgi:hypothetical protein
MIGGMILAVEDQYAWRETCPSTTFFCHNFHMNYIAMIIDILKNLVW